MMMRIIHVVVFLWSFVWGSHCVVEAFVPSLPRTRTFPVVGGKVVAATEAPAVVDETQFANNNTSNKNTKTTTTKDATESSVEFPPPLTTVERLQRAATFWSVAIPIVANYYGKFAEMKLREGLLGETMTDEEIEVRTRAPLLLSLLRSHAVVITFCKEMINYWFASTWPTNSRTTYTH
jgi:hypothetical protein